MNNREQFEADAEPYGFSLERYSTSLPTVEPWNEYKDSDTGHRWGGFIAGAESKQAEIAALKQELQALREQKPVAWIEHHKGGDNLSWDEIEHSYAKPSPLYAASVPASEGWKLVPIESTEEMQLAGMAELPLDSVIYTEAVYKAMLAAAPKEPA